MQALAPDWITPEAVASAPRLLCRTTSSAAARCRTDASGRKRARDRAAGNLRFLLVPRVPV